MILYLHRNNLAPAYTEGKMYDESGRHLADTLEPPFKILRCKGDKLPEGTAIPAGTYTVRVTPSPTFRRNLPRLFDVPYFDGVLIHSGNTVKDTRGCILVGKRNAPGQIIMSRMTLSDLLIMLKQQPSHTIIVTNPL